MRRGRAVQNLVLIMVLLLAAGLRFHGLDAQSLWSDEGTSAAMAQRDLRTIAQDAAGDIHPPLYYWMLSGWVRLLGTREAALRSLSALLGVGLVALTYALGRRLARRWTALAAAFLAAVNPFQVYYSQEARMYMLLAVLGAGALLALVRYVEDGTWAALAALTLLEAAGLYTHYSFAFVVLALNLALLLSLRRGARSGDRPQRLVLPWAVSQAAVMALYVPWLPVAVRQVRTWPSPVQAAAPFAALANTWRWLVFGPTIATEQVVVPLAIAAMVAAAGVVVLGARQAGKPALRGSMAAVWLCVWLGLPVALMFILGIYREAYLKFLLVTEPAVCILLAAGLSGGTQNKAQGAGRRLQVAGRVVQAVAAAILLAGTALSLRNYYAEPAYARDDYRGIAAYLEAVGRPGDAVVLNAPGQQEVFRYYYDGGLPVHPLPEERPLDPARTQAALELLAQPGGRVFAVLWATGESDPERFVEGWLDGHAYKALDSWYGNVRLAVYSMPEKAPSAPDRALDVPLADAATGDELGLVGYSLRGDEVAAGDIAQLSLFWQAERVPGRRYRTFVHVLDGANHIVGQRDAEPGGGARPTTQWAPGELVADHLGVPIHPATPPGSYRIEAGMYDAETGRRLETRDGATQVWLEPLEVARPAAPAPVAALAMQHPQAAARGDLELLGYDAYRLGSDAQADVPVRPGDVLHINLYWGAEAQPSGDWRLSVALEGPGGQEVASLDAEPVPGFSTGRWQAGDVWRGQIDLPIPAEAPPGRYRLRLQLSAPDGTPSEPILSGALRIGP